MTIFEKIIARQIPAEVLCENEHAIVIRDISPQAPVHLLAIPKKPIVRVAEASGDDALILGECLLLAAKAAKDCDLEQGGYRLVINNGPDAGETVPHLHVHVLGGRGMNWPPG
ncbi:MAG: histidine triad nucleotide-binding protein [Verrucomicrobiales bacterium]